MRPVGRVRLEKSMGAPHADRGTLTGLRGHPPYRPLIAKNAMNGHSFS